VSNFKAGNIIFDVVLIDSGKVTVEHIERLYQFSDAQKAQQFRKTAHERGLKVLEVNPSYGAECIAIFRSVDILSGHILPPYWK
jgi:uncharacterized protein (UPF0264 family)